MNLEIYQQLCAESKILWTQHCLQRMQERDISRADVKNGIATGEIIEDYPDDFPNPSCLIFGYNVFMMEVGLCCFSLILRTSNRLGMKRLWI